MLTTQNVPVSLPLESRADDGNQDAPSEAAVTTYAFYSLPPNTAKPGEWSLGPEYGLHVFHPGLFKIKPSGLPWWPLLGFWLLQRLHFFGAESWIVYFVTHRGKCVHRSVVLPRYFRFPFMHTGDLHVGPTWTDPDCRGQGIARVVLQQIVRDNADRRHWYIARTLNRASLSVASSVGFRFYGEGVWARYLGIRALGFFSVARSRQSEVEPAPVTSDTTRGESYKVASMNRYDSHYAIADGESSEWKSGARAMNLALRRPYLVAEEWLADRARGKRLLDFGSGKGIYSLFPAAHGANVVGLDISSKSMPVAVERAARAGLESRCSFLQGDCERLPFRDANFDVVISMGCLAFLRLDAAFGELARVTRPDGHVLIVDTLGHNPVLNLHRRLYLLRGARTRWEVEHIPKIQDIQIARRHFRRMEIQFLDITTLLVAPFCRKENRFTRALVAAVERLDRVLLRVPVVNKLAFKFVCILSEPVHDASCADDMLAVSQLSMEGKA